jgi:hypothetical protein
MRVTSWIMLGPAAFLVHDAEEVATIAPWLAAHRTVLPPIAQPLADITTRGFAVGVAVLFVGFVLAAAHGVHAARAGRRSWLWLIVAGAFAANGVTHVAQAAWVGGYVPGVATAVLASLPYSVGFARAYRSAGLASTGTLGLALLLGLLIQGPLALAALAAGAASSP